MNSAEYYSTYVADSNMSDLNYRVIQEIKNLQPSNAFEFGCGTGKNLKHLAGKNIPVAGLDISMMNIINAHCRFDLPCIIKSDDKYLKHLANFDVVFTVSVLDHIEDIREIIQEFKRIANKAVILAEAQLHNPKAYYYRHEYEEYGFKSIGYSYLSERPNGDGNEYKIWKWHKGQFTESGNSFVNDDLA